MCVIECWQVLQDEILGSVTKKMNLFLFSVALHNMETLPNHSPDHPQSCTKATVPLLPTPHLYSISFQCAVKLANELKITFTGYSNLDHWDKKDAKNTIVIELQLEQTISLDELRELVNIGFKLDKNNLK